MMTAIFVTVLIEGCSSVRMDEGGIEPFKSEAVKSALLFFMHFRENYTKKLNLRVTSNLPFIVFGVRAKAQ